MERRWQLQIAKNRLSEVIEQASEVGPQVITLRGRDKVVILSFEEYRRLTDPKGSLLEFFRNSPLIDQDLDFERSPDTGRELSL